ncbi:EVE domain-containing protein [Delftia sp. PS-11]|uniref:EVE domain-containing protein n=1 Tax=Delftia sp. PS-11 TaxID=2767222 RepID=UPI0024546E16|nr:EVE domain-containing protein [Delftia sp. PS-11]KAJ8743264.1 EVE domain-containing protein [Delftia sp. PS-11]
MTTDAPASRQFWLMKNEPDEGSIDHALAAPQATIAWDGVRNYQARNFMRDAMRPGDGVLYWHSSCAEPGIYGIARIASGPRTDTSQFDPHSPYHDPRASSAAPRWLTIDVQALCKVRPLLIADLRAHPQLAQMQVLQKGSRLSITPVTPQQWDFIHDLLQAPAHRAF